jgi:hypothetical protein
VKEFIEIEYSIAFIAVISGGSAPDCPHPVLLAGRELRWR